VEKSVNIISARIMADRRMDIELPVYSWALCNLSYW